MPKKKEQPKEKEQTEVRIIMNEAGTSGLKESGGFITEAYNSALWFPQCQPLYSRLRTSMPEIVMIRRAFSTWANNIRPVVNLPEDASDDDKKYRDFLESDFDNMDGGFVMWLDTCVNYVPFMGWGWWDVQPSIRSEDWKPPAKDDDWYSEEDDGYIGIRRIAWRDNSTFAGWELSRPSKRLLGMWQQDYPNPKTLLEYNKSLHINFGGANSPEGTTPLEAVWRLERIKYGFEVIQGIGFEHAAGHLSVKKVQSGDISSTDRTNVASAAKAILSAQEGNYAIWPYGLDGNVIDIGFQSAGTILDAIKHYSILVLSLYTMQWIALNTFTNTGAYASQVDSTNSGVGAFNAMIDSFAAQYDNQIGKRLWTWNKESFPGRTQRPHITFTHIENNLGLTELGTFWSSIYDKLPIGLDDYNAFRQKVGWLPEETPEDALEEMEEKKDAEKKARQNMKQNLYGEKDKNNENDNAEEDNIEEEINPDEQQANTEAKKAIEQALYAFSRRNING